jgi:hypothetical protein
MTVIASDSEATQTEPQLESLGLGRFALLAMTEASPRRSPSVLSFHFDGARRTGGA